jgi:hypothetical protein
MIGGDVEFQQENVRQSWWFHVTMEWLVGATVFTELT